MAVDICLGTAQFGSSYGITNSNGIVTEKDVREILHYASQEGIKYLDTAQSYGSAEDVLGRTTPRKSNFEVITKLPAQRQAFFTADDISVWEKNYCLSLKRLKRLKLNGLLLHNASDLRKPGSEHLKKWLLSLRKRHMVKNLGVSIYGSSDLIQIEQDFLDIVQLPLSLYDQRLILDGTISKLKSDGSSVHVRSVFLQGLLLANTGSWPLWIDQSSRDHHARFEAFALAKESSQIELALNFIRSQKEVDAVVVGFCSLVEIQQIIKAWNKRNNFSFSEWNTWALDDPKILDPRFWPKKS